MAPPVETGSRVRRRYIDWARGLAVLVMIEAHTLDAWTHASARSGPVYTTLAMLGGFAAPLFLWLAGLSLALSAARTLERTGRRAEATAAVIRRAAGIFILAFLFRLQAFIVSPGSWLVTIFRVDILNVMGLSMAAAGLAWGAARTARQAAWLSGALAVATAMVTPLVRSAGWVDLLPIWIQWHLRPFGDHTTFTLLPWAGFVFAGMSSGTLLTLWSDRRHERLGLLAFGGVGLFLVWLGLYTASKPSLYLASSFWTSSPTFFAIRAGLLLILLAVLYGAAEMGAARVPVFGWLQTLGRNSLFIYWIHVELVYGYATWPLRGALPLWGTALAFVFFAGAMYAAIGLGHRIVEQWPLRNARNSAVGAVPA